MAETTAFQVALQPLYQGTKPLRNAKYLAFIRRQASVVSGYGGCHACHTGMHAGNQKSSDLDCIPLTWKEHAAFDADPRGYALLHGLDIPAIIARLNAAYNSKFGADDE